MNVVDSLAIYDSILYYKNLPRKTLPKYYVNYKIGTFYYQLATAKYCKFSSQDSSYVKKYYKGNDFEVANRYFVKSIKQNKEFTPAQFYGAFTDYDFPSKMRKISKTIELDSDNSTYYFQRAKLQSSTCFSDEALEDFNKCIQLTPDDYRPYVGRARILSMRLNGKAPTASEIQLIEQDFETALRLPCDSIAVLYQRGKARSYFIKNYPGAIADYNKILAFNPSFTWVYRERAVAYHSNKQFDLSCSDYKKWKSLGSTSYDWQIKEVCGISYEDWIKKE